MPFYLSLYAKCLCHHPLQETAHVGYQCYILSVLAAKVLVLLATYATDASEPGPSEDPACCVASVTNHYLSILCMSSL